MDARRIEALRKAAREAVERTRAEHVAERIGVNPDRLARWIRTPPPRPEKTSTGRP